MSLAPGSRVGPYEVTAQIGRGGMGEVYRARDTRLHRDVALKVLPDAVAGDATRLARFRREAQVLAALNHPHIATIHGLEEPPAGQGAPTLVMELVEGPTLADVIAHGRMTPEAESVRSRPRDTNARPARGGGAPRGLNVDDALAIAKQIADALEAAHEQGIIHRDLKPSNIKVRPDGTVKVLDFGLAKALAPDVPLDADAPTITSPATLTQAGVLLGTAAYMAPEQAMRKPADRRADIWAFGVVLYEMLTGRRAFEGDDVTEVLAGVIKTDPDWSALPADLPPAIRTCLGRCLQKVPRQRLQAIGDARLALEGAFDVPGAAARPAPDSPGVVRWRVVALGLSVVAGALIATAVVWQMWPRHAHEVNSFLDALPNDLTFRNTGRAVLALSPDGRTFVYNTTDGLYLRSMGEPEARQIAGTEGALTSPFFSPDGRSIGFFQAGALKRVPAGGGPPQDICLATNPRGASWEPNGTILFGQRQGIMRVSAEGGDPELVVPAGDGELLHGPQLLPDGRTILFTVAPVMFLDPVVTARWDEAQVAAQRLGSADRTVILTGGTDARYVPTGHLVYAAGGTLLAAPFDVSRLVLGGPAVPVVEHLRPSNDGSSANYAFSDGGTFVAVRASDYTGRSELVWVERSTGREERLQAPPRAYSNPRVSPDGTRIAVTMRDGEQDIHVLDIGQGVLRPLTANATPDYQPELVDDRRLVLASVVDGSYQVFLQDADGLTPARQLTEGSVHTFPTSVSRNGRTVLVEGAGPPCCDLGVLTIDPLAPVQWIANTPELERTPVLSPNGEWLAYQANRRGRGEVYVRRFPVEGSDVPLTTDGGSNPVWARDGSELYYWTVQDGTVTIMAVRATSGPPSAWGRAEPVISGPFIESQGDTQYDVAPDGRFLVLKKASGSRPADGILIIQNWTEELTRLVPVDGDRSGA